MKMKTKRTKRPLTLKKLDNLKEGIFAKGETIDSPEGANMANTGRTIKWVAVRGVINDWAIYLDNPFEPEDSYQDVSNWGDKLHNRETIKKLVPCDDEALERYRD